MLTLCPVCHSNLIYVEHIITRNAYPLTELTITNDAGRERITPRITFDGKSSVILEVLERTIECESASCAYQIGEADLGDIA